MTCEFCGGETVKKKVRKHYWLHGKLYVVENVDAEVCRQCGERYYHATTLDAIDKLLEGKHEVKKSMEVEVVSL